MTTPKKRLLVVDDEPSMRLLMAHYLGDAFDVATCENGWQACAWLGDGNVPDAVLTDLEMPVMNGWELLKRLRMNRSTREIPCGVVSGKTRHFFEPQSRRLGANGFLPKPFTADQLTSYVEHIASTPTQP